VKELAVSLLAVAQRLGSRREALVASWAEAVRSTSAIAAVEATALCAQDAESLLERLGTGAVEQLLSEDEAAATLAVRSGKGLRARLAAVRVFARCCVPLLDPAPDGLSVAEALLALHELGIRRLECLLRVQEEEWSLRLADAQDQTARAVERAQEASRTAEELRRSESRSQHRAEQLALLGSVTHRIAGILDPEELLQQAATTIQARMNHTYVAVVLRAEDGAIVGRWAGRPGIARESGGRAKGPPRGVIGRALRKRAPQVVPDVTRDADYLPDVPGTRSEMVVPLIEAGETVGAIDFQSERPAAFDLDDVVAAEVLAEFLIVALRNARLFASRDKE